MTIPDFQTLSITWRMDLDCDGEDADPANPLARAIRRLLQYDGQPFSRLSQCFFRDALSSEATGTCLLRWFGVFVLTDGRQISFFPGYEKAMVYVQGFQDKMVRWNQEFDFDHLTLQKDLAKWHLTSVGSKKHLGRLPTCSLGEGRVLWFGMSIAASNVLPTVSKETIITAQVPASDSKRRGKVFLEARDSAIFQIVEEHPEASTGLLDTFLHFAVIVGPSGFSLYEGDKLGFPEGSPFVQPGFQEVQQSLPIRHHRIALSETLDLQLTASSPLCL